MSKKTFQSTTSVEMSRIYFICLAVNIVVLMFANKIAPMSVVFGTSVLTPTWGLFLSMGALSLINTLLIPVFDSVQEELSRALTTKEWMIGYFLINFVGLWLVSRFAEQFGFGISSWGVAGLIAIVLDFAQGAGIMYFIGNNKK